jgi:hypothetical protein
MRPSSLTLAALALSPVFLGCTPETKPMPSPSDMASSAKEMGGKAMEATGMKDLLSKATESLSSVEGGADMLKGITDSFGSITKTLGSVKDEASATAALPDLSKLTETFGGMTEKFGVLPEAAKSAVAGIFASSLGELKPMLDKILAIPGVEAILKPAIDALMEKLGAFKA